MARYVESVCKICRREGSKLFLKGDRCFSSKCAVEKRAYAPGEHGQRRIKATDYSVQLREKQKMRRSYGILEKQFRNYFRKAERLRGTPGDNLIRLIERRLDNVVYRFGFASSRAEARQLVSHGHFTVNGRRVNIPSLLLRSGDVVAVKESSRELLAIQGALESAKRRTLPSWLELDAQKLTGTVKSWPTREEVSLPIQDELIVAIYSK
ncbi:MAG: 30S ribosomal protein S4 [candidate division NC10 bacterium]|nr:30S ribosomal protein S4 [candidate division NC10 bacterium]